MSDLSDKYKNALDGMNISPDFKERTAEKMKMLRNGRASAPSSEQINISVDNTSGSRRIVMLKIISAAAAAAACVAVCITLSKAGVLDRDMELAVQDTAAAATEVTDHEPEESTHSTAAQTAVYETSETLTKETQPDMPPPAESACEDVTETEAIIPDALRSEASDEPVAAQSSAAVIPENNEATEEAGIFQAGAVLPDQERLDPSLPLEPVADEEVYSPEYMDIPETEEDDGVFDDDCVETILEEETPAPSVYDEAASFSAKAAVSAFKAQDSAVTITPVSEDVKESFGEVTTYEAKTVRSVTKLIDFSKKLYAYAEDGTASLVSSSPADSRYIIDMTDNNGNAMRIWFGSRYICFMSGGKYYRFELTQEEYSALDKEILAMID